MNRTIAQQVARDLMEDGRCGRSHDIAKSFDLTVSDTDPFWKDRTFVELNYAVSGHTWYPVHVCLYGMLSDRTATRTLAVGLLLLHAYCTSLLLSTLKSLYRLAFYFYYV